MGRNLAQLSPPAPREIPKAWLSPSRRDLLAQGNALTPPCPSMQYIYGPCPCFHCNGWCFPWTLSAIVGTHVCLRAVRQKAMWDKIADHKVTHMCGAPIVMSTLLSASPEDKRELTILWSFSPPLPRRQRLFWRHERCGFNVTHLYGLTECYGPAVVNDWNQGLGRARGCRASSHESPSGRALSGAGRSGGYGP